MTKMIEKNRTKKPTKKPSGLSMSKKNLSEKNKIKDSSETAMANKIVEKPLVQKSFVEKESISSLSVDTSISIAPQSCMLNQKLVKKISLRLPKAKSARILETGTVMLRLGDTDFFLSSEFDDTDLPYYRVLWSDHNDIEYVNYDLRSFPQFFLEEDIRKFNAGQHFAAHHFLGARAFDFQGLKGVLFGVWAPNARSIRVIGEFNDWDGTLFPMRAHGESGVWEAFVPEAKIGHLYKYEIVNQLTGELRVKADPYAQECELRPNSASRVPKRDEYSWSDSTWLQKRRSFNVFTRPISIYELHLGSWSRNEKGEFLTYRESAVALVEYVKKLGFTHLELLPVMEHPFDLSWGYQVTGFFAPTSRFGTPDDFKWFVDYCHQNEIGVILDWVPAHFPKDDFSLARFDGTHLYEHECRLQAEHPDWGTLIFNYDRHEVRSFLLSNVAYWLEVFHIDGIRVDAVSSILYLDYSRDPGQWVPNHEGNNLNYGGLTLLKQFNHIVQSDFPGVFTVAEESSATPCVTTPLDQGGLGFQMKWSLGWMHDSLGYFKVPPESRHKKHHDITFCLWYAFTEHFNLSLSHDEVVHGKSPLIYKMPGDEWQKFANLRLLYTFMFTHPGKKLLFMGAEFAATREWNCEQSLPWDLLQYPTHIGIQKAITDLNSLYKRYPALYYYEESCHTFEWLDCNNTEQSIYSYARRCKDEVLLVILNCQPIAYEYFQQSVPQAGEYREIFNSDSSHYHGSDFGNIATISSESKPCNGKENSICLKLPPLGALILKWKKSSEDKV